MKKHIYTIANFAGSIALALLLYAGGIDISNQPWVFLAILACLCLLAWSSYFEGIERGIAKAVASPQNVVERKTRLDTGCLKETAADAYEVPAFLRKRKG